MRKRLLCDIASPLLPLVPFPFFPLLHSLPHCGFGREVLPPKTVGGVSGREREREQQENPNIGGTYFERGSRRKAFIIGLSERRGSFSDQISERQCKIFGDQGSQFSEHK